MRDTIKDVLMREMKRTDFCGDIGGFVWVIKDDDGEEADIELLADKIATALASPPEEE